MTSRFKKLFVVYRTLLIGLWVFLVLVIIFFIFFSAWAENDSKITHVLKLDNVSYSSYLKIELHKVQPREPIVNTTLLIFTDDPNQIIRKSVAVGIAGARGYGNHLIILPGRSFGDGILFSDQSNYVPLFPVKGSHAWFPFDNLEFNTTIITMDSLLLGELELVNRVDGFKISGQPKVERNGQEITLKFHLNRNMFLKVFSSILAIASVIFVTLILILVFRAKSSIEEQSFSIAGFFISLWSIRGIVGQGLETFPSLLDFWILGLFVVLLMGTLLKLILWYTSKAG